MKILAIIPARAGSKGIPNKNIRIINEHPLVFYSINNAKQSKFITDIIVTTDSDTVKIIAEQLGVGLKNRAKELCTDEITLDSVIYDAIPKNTKWDYIVTMQPTSPTLTPETLDQAIEYTIKNELDTVISAINKPHLSWSKKRNSFVPNYKERLNRQYLPPHYLETGAFVISKANVVTEKTRIGKKVSIYEIPENEAQDIDDFQDLHIAETLLTKQSVAIYVNGNNTRGTGHIYRALELADEFFVKPDIYYDKNQTSRNIFGTTTHNLIPVNSITDLFQKCKEKQYSIFINDILSTSIDYMIGLRNVLPNSKIVNFEDDGEGATKADLVFNALYNQSDASNIYAGEKYYIPNKKFIFYDPIDIRKNVQNVLISFGGSDPQNYTDRLLKIVSKKEYKSYNFHVVLGRNKQNVDELFSYNQYKNITIYHDIDNMPKIMSSCDIAITSRGRTGYELAMLGIPTIAMAQNKREEKHGFVCDENGFNYIGLNPGNEVIEANLNMFLKLSPTERQKYSTLMLKHNLRNGRKRVMTLINNL